MKFTITCKLPKTNAENRLHSPAWLAFKTDIARAILAAKIKEAKK